MDEQTRGHIAALRFAVGRIIRDVALTTPEGVSGFTERLKDFGNDVHQSAKQQSSSPPDLDFSQKEYLSGMLEEIELLSAVIDPPVLRKGRV